MEDIDRLMTNTNMPQCKAVPDLSVFNNLLLECENSDSGDDLKKGALILLCSAIEADPKLKQMRDLTFIEELLKSKLIINRLRYKHPFFI
jgi:hypothetical protein